MKKLLIIYPHWPPSNLAGVHRSRLIANYSRNFGWDVTVLTVDSDHYEEQNDLEIERLVAPHVDVRKVNAFPVLKPFGIRILGDIGIRGWIQMRRRMIEILRNEQFDFLWIPIPSWYTSLLGRVAQRKFGIPFGIDYIDPWVYQLTEYEKIFSRQWWTRQVALRLEPKAIRKAQLITGVSAEYYAPALARVFPAGTAPPSVAMPYGFDPNDHRYEPTKLDLPWKDNSLDYALYAGAFLPHSEIFFRALFSVMAEMKANKSWPTTFIFRFVGTGERKGVSITSLSIEYGVNDIVEEYPHRIPFLAVQSLLRKASGSLIIGSTEPHYTASKTFQCLLAGKPIFAIFHSESSASTFMEEANADAFLVKWNQDSESELYAQIHQRLIGFVRESTSIWQPDLTKLEPYTSKESARVLFNAIDAVLQK